MRAILLCLVLVAACSSKSNPAPGAGPVPGSGGTSGSDPTAGSGGTSGGISGGISGGTSGEVDPGGTSGSGSIVECEVSECGRRLGMPVLKCDDGSLGGNTSRCLRHADGRCGWEIRACPAGKP